MRKVEIISDINIASDTGFMSAVNKVFEKIAQNGGTIIKTQYNTTKMGNIRNVIIEYEAAWYQSASENSESVEY